MMSDAAAIGRLFHYGFGFIIDWLSFLSWWSGPGRTRWGAAPPSSTAAAAAGREGAAPVLAADIWGPFLWEAVRAVRFTAIRGQVGRESLIFLFSLFFMIAFVGLFG